MQTWSLLLTLKKWLVMTRICILGHGQPFFKGQKETPGRNPKPAWLDFMLLAKGEREAREKPSGLFGFSGGQIPDPRRGWLVESLGRFFFQFQFCDR